MTRRENFQREGPNHFVQIAGREQGGSDSGEWRDAGQARGSGPVQTHRVPDPGGDKRSVFVTMRLLLRNQPFNIIAVL